MVEAILPENNKGVDQKASNITVTPRFFFGLKGDVTNNCLFVDDNTVIYPCGHNVILYSMSEKIQRYIPGIEGSQGITSLAISPSKRYLAVCEQSTNAVCSVYFIQTFLEKVRDKKSTITYDSSVKKKKVLITNEDSARKYISADFCAQNNERQLVTISGGSEARIIIWNWDKQKCIPVTDLLPKLGQTITQISFAPNDPNVIVATGNDFYRYFRLDNNSIKQQQVQIQRRDKDAHFSTNYTCHKWLNDGRFIICTDHGQILLLEASGEYKNIFIMDTRKDPFPIWAVTSFTGLGQPINIAAA